LSDAETVCTRPVPSRCTTAGNCACMKRHGGVQGAQAGAINSV
jgi:hypothetical protein